LGVPLGVSWSLELECFNGGLIHLLKGGLVFAEEPVEDLVEGLLDMLEIVYCLLFKT